MAGAVASLAVAFVGGMQVDRFYQRPLTDPFGQVLSQTDLNMNEEAYYYLGRSLLENNQADNAIVAFRNAEMLRPDNPTYTLWKGVAYQQIGELEKERSSYQQVINWRPDFVPARRNLAHSLLQDGKVSEAEALYGQILDSYPLERTALYNRALALRIQGKVPLEIEAWKEYLDYYRTGPNAYRAVKHLHERRDYTYRVYQVGPRAIILNQDRLLNPKSSDQDKEINHLLRQLKGHSLSDLSIAVFVQDDVQRARTVANSLRMSLIDQANGVEKATVRISWFNEAEPIKTLNDEKANLSEGILIFSAVANNAKRGEKT
jgi:tetratricopeptide (TPR) repeat protein